MNEISSSIWLRKGSSVVFNQASLGPLISGGAMVSLRQALGWMTEWPSEPPVPGKTVLVSGLETIIEVMEPDEAEAFLRGRLRPLIQEFQRRWDQCGLVFGFSSHERAFEVTTLSEAVLFRRRDRRTVQLSEALWDGSATINLCRILARSTDGENQTVGFHVARIS